MEFQFSKVNFDPVGRTVLLEYRFLDGAETRYTEILQLPLDWPIREVPHIQMQVILDSLLLACGVGYWKLRASGNIQTDISLSDQQAQFWNLFYSEGMGEFIFCNQLHFQHGLFRGTKGVEENPLNIKLSDRVLVGISGGKDSLVTAETFAGKGIDFTPFLIRTQGQRDSLEPIFKELGRKPFIVERTLDPQLFQSSSGYKGHVPISAIYAFIAVLCGVLYDFRAFIVSNERSSNYGNTEYEGTVINHQWSKSWRFESLFRNYCERFLVSNFSYFSFLRPLSELAIMKSFAAYSKWHQLFSSCNRVLRQRPDKTRWCGECPKCAFAFVLLAAFLEQSKVIEIFGADMFNDPKLVSIFDELLGRSGIKPFDCVGTPEEVQAAFCLIAERGEWNDSSLMEYVLPYLPQGVERSRIIENEFALSDAGTILQPWKSVFESSFL